MGVFDTTVPIPSDGLYWVGPVITAVAALLVGTLSAISLLWRRRQDRRDVIADDKAGRVPTEKDEWREVRDARAETSRYYRLYRTFEDLFYEAHSALRHLASDVHVDHPDQEFAPDVVKALGARPPDDLEKV